MGRPLHGLVRTLTSYLCAFGDCWLTVAVASRIPYFIRLRQCLVEWVSSDYKNGRPLANALKYASAFPVILFSAVQKVVVQDLAQKGATDVSNETWHGEHPLFRLWFVFHGAFA